MKCPTEASLIAQIEALPNTVVQKRIQAHTGLGAITIYHTLPNVVRGDSIWVGRKNSIDQLTNYLRIRQGGAA